MYVQMFAGRPRPRPTVRVARVVRVVYHAAPDQVILWGESAHGARRWHVEVGSGRLPETRAQRASPMQLWRAPGARSLVKSPGATWQRFMRHSLHHFLGSSLRD